MVPTISWIAGDGDWNDPANWSTGVLPGPNDDVLIDRPGVSVTITRSTGSTTIKSLQFQESLVVSGGSLTITNSIVNGGTVTVSGSGILNLGGSFTAADLGSINSSGGIVNLTGTLNNAGSTLTLNATTGSWRLAGGTISGGTIATSGGAKLLATFSGTLDGVTVNGDLDLVSNSSFLQATITNGLTLNGTAFVGTPSNIGYGSALSFKGTQSLSGTGAVAFGYANFNTLRLEDAGSTLTIGPGITVRGQSGVLGYSAGQWGGPSNVTVINQGTINADTAGGTLKMDGTNWSNAGLITATAGTIQLGGTFGLTGGGTISSNGGLVDLTGTLNNAGSTLSLNATTGSWRLAGGTISGGTIATSGGAKLLATFSGTLDGVTVNGDLDLVSNSSMLQARITNGLTLNGTAFVGTTSSIGYGSALSFKGTQSLSGTGTVVFGHASFNTLRLEDAGTTLTIGPGITVRGQSGVLGYSAGQWGGPSNVTVINQGTINADTAGGTLKMDGTNWSNAGLITATAGTIQLGGTFGLTGGGTISSNGGLVDLTGTLNNAGSTLSLNATTGSWRLAGGTISGGTIATSGGAKLLATFSGTLDGVTVNGDLDLVSNSSMLQARITNGLTLNGTAFVGTTSSIGYGSALSFKGTQSLSGTGTVAFGHASFNTLRLEDAGTTLTIGPGITVRGQSGVLGYSAGQWGGPSNVTVINQGTINADTAGGTLKMDGANWSNAGLITATAGTIQLGGTFGLTGGGTIGSNGGLVDLTGTLNNAGSTLSLNATTGSWRLAGGTISGGTIATSGGAKLLATFSGTLDGVTVNGDLDLVSNSSFLQARITNGLTLNGTAFVGTPSNIGYGSALSFKGTQSLSGTGAVAFGYANFNTLRLEEAGTTLTIGPGIRVRGQSGVLGYSAGQWGGPSNVTVINQGTINADTAGGTLKMDGANWSNAGLITATAGTIQLGGTFGLTGGGTISSNGGLVDLTGTLNNAGSTLSLNATTGSWRLAGGTISGGTIATSGGAKLLATFSGTLDGVTVNGDLDLVSNSSFLQARITNGLTLNGTAFVGTPSNIGYGSALSFKGTQSLSGTGAVVFGYANFNTLRLEDAGSTLTIGPGITVRGQSGVLGYSAGQWGGPSDVTVINQGTINADGTGGTVTISGQMLTNLGTLKATTGTLAINAPISIDAAGILLGSLSSNLIVTESFQGNTANTSLYAMLGTLRLNGIGSLASPQLFEAMSRDMGSAVSGFIDNFVYGTLILGSNNYVKLVDQSDNAVGPESEALYVNSLIVPSGTTLDLNGVHVYARAVQVGGTLVRGTINQIPDSGPILLATPTPGNISIAGELDEWQFFGRGGRSVTVLINPGTGALAPQLNWAQIQLLDSANNVLASADNDNASGAIVALNDVALPADDNYKVQVRAPSAHTASTGNYLLTVWDVTADVATLNLNQQVTGSIETPFSIDRWNFSAASGQQVRFDLINTSTTGLVFSLTGPQGFTGFSVAGDSDLVTLSASGNYVLKATGTSGQTGAYAFRLLETTQTNLPLEATFTGTLAGSGQAQLFLVSVPSAKPMVVHLDDSTNTDHNELYAKFGSAPTRSDYDFRYSAASSADQNLLITSATPGTGTSSSLVSLFRQQAASHFRQSHPTSF